MMRRVLLNGERMRTREEMHSHLAQRLGLPAYYGKNLDALSDSLSELSGVHITLRRRGAMLAGLQEYGFQLMAVLAAATRDNPGLRFRATDR